LTFRRLAGKRNAPGNRLGLTENPNFDQPAVRQPNRMIIRVADMGDALPLSQLAMETYTTAFGRSMSAADLAAQLERHLTLDSFRRMLEEDGFLLAEEEGRLSGYVQFGWAVPDGGFFFGTDQELKRLYVLAEFQNRGVGTALMETALAHPTLRTAPRIVLDVWEHNEGARRFYERFGFEAAGWRVFEVASGEEMSRDLVMVRQDK